MCYNAGKCVVSHAEELTMIVQLVVAAGHRTGQVIPILTEKFVIGRAEDCHLRSRSELMSRYHCAILVGDDVVVRDLGSKNGVLLNGEKVQAEHKLGNGDSLVIGPLKFYIHIVSADDDLEGLSTDGHVASHITHHGHPSNSVAATEETAAILLDHLKALNPEAQTEPEQPVLDLVKKFL